MGAHSSDGPLPPRFFNASGDALRCRFLTNIVSNGFDSRDSFLRDVHGKENESFENMKASESRLEI